MFSDEAVKSFLDALRASTNQMNAALAAFSFFSAWFCRYGYDTTMTTQVRVFVFGLLSFCAFGFTIAGAVLMAEEARQRPSIPIYWMSILAYVIAAVRFIAWSTLKDEEAIRRRVANTYDMERSLVDQIANIHGNEFPIAAFEHRISILKAGALDPEAYEKAFKCVLRDLRNSARRPLYSEESLNAPDT